MTMADRHERDLVAKSTSYTVFGQKRSEFTKDRQIAMSLRPYLKRLNYVLGPTLSGQRGGGGGG